MSSAVTPAAVTDSAVGVVLLHAAGRRPEWTERAAARVFTLAAGRRDTHEVAEAVGADAGAECVLIDAHTLDALPTARLVHQVDAEVQVIAVVDTQERRRALERAMLFAPGIGEVWLASSGEVVAGLVERAVGVTRQRRKFRRTRERLERDGVTQSPQRTERALISDAYLANLLQVLPDAVFSVDAAGRILSATPAAERLLNIAGSDLVGSTLVQALRTSDAPALKTLLAEATQSPRGAEVTFQRGDGEAGYGELIVTHVAGSEPAFSAVVLHDLTERRLAQQQLEDQALELEHQSSVVQDQAMELEQTNDELLRQRTDLETALATRSRFYASMNHELRTPINAVIGYTALALEGIYGPLAAPLRDALTRSQRAAKHLQELVDDVLDLAKIEAGRIDLSMETVDLTLLADDVLITVRPAAEANGTAVLLDCRGDVSAPVVTDARRVRQILLNLLGNAVKFGAGRPVSLLCEAIPGAITISVVDQGFGIPESEHERIFEEFVQLDPERHRGTGLGLPISRRLAAMLGGTLTVASVQDQGSTFALTLPTVATLA
ncbi:MAG: PAS domain-containing sensor histidine kinase [Gemmatimonadaceae bacterium]